MKTWLKLGFGIGFGLAALWLLYMGTQLLPIEGLTLQTGLFILAGLGFLVAAAQFITDSQSEMVVKALPPMPPSISKWVAPKVAPAKRKAAQKAGKKKRRK